MDDSAGLSGYAGFMLDYVRERAVEVLKNSRRAYLATYGPAGVQAGEFPCEARGLNLYLLVPQTSNHLFNLELDPTVTLLSTGWELKGRADIIPLNTVDHDLDLLAQPGAEWCALLRVVPNRIQILREKGWGYAETLELNPSDQNG